MFILLTGTVFILLIQYASLLISATELLPALQLDAETGPAVIRGLIDIDKRQTYYCPAPWYSCVYRDHCCPGTYRCCRDGTCCEAGTYCVLASNGIIGCCPVGGNCGGPVGPPTTSHFTRTITSYNTFATTDVDAPSFTLKNTDPTGVTPSTPRSSLTSTSDLVWTATTPSPVVASATTQSPRNVTSATTSSRVAATTIPTIEPTLASSNAAIGTSENVAIVIAILTFLGIQVSNAIVT